MIRPRRRHGSLRSTPLVLVFLLGFVPVTPSADEVTVAAVQFEVSEELYASPARLERTIERLVVRAQDAFGADIVVFPEYVNAFLLASRFPRVLEIADDFDEALSLVVGREAGIDALAEVFRANAAWIASRATAMWSRLADRHDTVVVAGTLFVPVADAEGSELRNRLLVFDESGALIYSQDKVFLTEYEARLLRIEPGTVRAGEPLVIDGLELGFTICRDTFFDAWESELGGVDLWVDVRANGEPYSRAVYERFLGALPERVAETEVAAGITASLTGEFLGEVWAGPSFAVDGDGRRIAASDDPVGTQITAVRMVERGARWTPQPVVPRY